MKKKPEVYLFGQILGTKGGFLQPDEYSEISEKYFLPGGETEAAEGLTIITQGGGEMLYARRGEEIHRMNPIPVEVRSTLGAGDTYKAGCVYGLLQGMSDKELVRFASACSGIAISRFPLPLHPPKLSEVQALIRSAPED